MQSGFEDFPVLLLGAAIALGRLPFKGIDEIFRELSHHQLRHCRTSEFCL